MTAMESFATFGPGLPTPEAIKPPPYTEELKMRIVGEEVGFDGEIRCA